MRPIDQAAVVIRLVQISVALLAFWMAIVASVNSGRFHVNGWYMMASVMCFFDTAALGGVGLLAIVRPQDLAAYLVLVFDALALAATIAAGIVGETNAQNLSVLFAASNVAIVASQLIRSNARRYSRWTPSFSTIYAFSFIAIGPIAIAMLRTMYVWWESSMLKPAPPVVAQAPRKSRPEPWSPQDIRRLEKRIEQLEAEARHRPFTPSETIARWTAVSGNATLSDLE